MNSARRRRIVQKRKAIKAVDPKVAARTVVKLQRQMEQVFNQHETLLTSFPRSGRPGYNKINKELSLVGRDLANILGSYSEVLAALKRL